MTNQSSETGSSKFDVGGDRQDELFEVLSHSRRRFVLQELQTAETPVSVSELTTEIVMWEAQRPVSERSGDDRNAIKASLVHGHLPKMARAGLIGYDDDRKTVTNADGTREVRAYLPTLSSEYPGGGSP